MTTGPVVSKVIGTFKGCLGATGIWRTTFFDIDGNITTPNAAFINISYFQNGALTSAQIQMSPPNLSSGQTQWMGFWDSRGTDGGQVSWSLHSTSSPYAVANGQFRLDINNATLSTF